MKRKIFSKLLMGAFLIASVSMFVSCKDYDDDISKTNQDITALKSQLSTLESNLTSQLNSAKSDLASAKSALEAAIAAKADASTVSDLSGKVTDAIGRITSLEAQIATLDEYAKKVDLAAYAKTEDLNGYAKEDAVQALIAEAIATVTGDIQAVKDQIPSNEELVALIAQNAAAKTLETQVAALENFQREVAAANYLKAEDLTSINNEITELKNKIEAIQIPEAVDIEAIQNALAGQFQGLNDQITKLSSDLSVINIFVNKKLSSIVLKPDFYWEGIEGIEVPFMYSPEFKEDGAYDFTYTVWRETKGDEEIKVHVNNVMGWLTTDDKILVSETDKTWNKEIGFSKPSDTASGISSRYSLIDLDGVRMAASKKATLQYVLINPYAEAKYHINPANADLTDYKYSFYENIAEVYTRGANRVSIEPEIAQAQVGFDKGILTVPFKVNTKIVWDYFYKWAFDNNTWAQYQTHNANVNTTGSYSSGYEPRWDNEWFTYVNYSTNRIPELDEEGNPTGKYYYEYDFLGAGETKISNYGTSDYSDGQDVAPLPFVSLTATKNDTTVVNSDYAVVVPAVYNIIALADSCPNTSLSKNTFQNTHIDEATGASTTYGQIRNNHLYETVGVEGTKDYRYESTSSYNSPGAIPSPATHEVVYDSLIDLKPFIETHYSYTTYTRYGQSTVDKKMDAALMAKLGLHYEFKKIDYTIGKNVTSESAHIEQIGDATSGVFAPRSVTENGETITGKTATKEVVDREPLIRVDLIHTDKDGKKHIVRYGYIKLRIVEAEESYEDIDVDITLGDVYMNCGDQARITWSQVEALILRQLGDGKGMSKKNFEENYRFVDEGWHWNMPTNDNGKLYEVAANNNFWGQRFYVSAIKNGKWVVKEAAETTSESYAVNNYTYEKWDTLQNWFGRVWYTPHDNATTGHDWDEQTNVLIWDLHGYDELVDEKDPAYYDNAKYAGNMTGVYTGKNLYKKLIDVSGATYESKGLNKHAISTVVRFQNKNTLTYINVRLTIPVGKMHFEYGEIGKKDWAHWYGFNSADPGVAADDDAMWPNNEIGVKYGSEFDAHINPFKPSNNGYKVLDVTDYKQLLTDNWLDPSTMIDLKGDKAKFSKFYKNNKPNLGVAPSVSFEFTYPVKGTNSKSVDARTITLEGKDFANAWEVYGISQTKWTLQVRDFTDPNTGETIVNGAIYAVGKNDKLYRESEGFEEVCHLEDANVANTKNSRIVYRGLEKAGAAKLYPAATDLVNLVGAYNEKGDARFDLGSGLNTMTNAEYLDNNVGKTFTAYMKLVVVHGLCYEPLIGKNYFNVRVHRPINVVGKEYVWNDRVLNDNRLAIKDLIEVVDWNRFPVVAYNTNKISARNTMFGIEQPAYSTVYNNVTTIKQQNVGMPFEYYGISELAVRYQEIRTDHAKQPGVRANKYYTTADIKANTDKVKDLNSLTSLREPATGLRTLSLLHANGKPVDFDDEFAYNHSDQNASGNGTQFGWIYYNNNASTVQEFHIYVPIAVKYNWGNISHDYLLDADGDKLDKDYTQTVWAIITVKDTHSAAREK